MGTFQSGKQRLRTWETMVKKLVFSVINNPRYYYQGFVSKLFVMWFSRKDRIKIGTRSKIVGAPIIDIGWGCFLEIGENVLLNSKNRGHHVNMLGPVKIFTDEKDAVIKIGDNTRIHGSCIHARESITIGKNCLIGANCNILDSNGHETSFPDVENRIHTRGYSKPIIIADNVWIGANCFILPGVKIGKGSIISANSVVTKDIPSMVIAAGNPARVVKEYKTNDNVTAKPVLKASQS